MRRIFAVLVLGVLAACTEEPPVVIPAEVFRDTSAQIASQTNVTADRMAGDWIIRQRFAALPAPRSAMSLSTLPNGALQLSLLSGGCVDDVCFEEETLVLFDPTGPGRWTPVDPPAGLIDGELWVMWMDFDSRTAAVHVDATNDLAYTPLPLRIMAALADTCKEIKGKQDAEIKAIENQTPAILKNPACAPDTEVGKLMSGLSVITTNVKVGELAELSETEEVRLKTLAPLQTQRAVAQDQTDHARTQGPERKG